MSSIKHQEPAHSETALDKRAKFLSLLIDQKNTVVVQILFLKLFTLVYIIALTSIYIQIPGLYGRDGLLPLNNSLNKIENHYGSNKYNVMPTIFWLSKEINNYLVWVFPSIKPYQAEENVFHFLCLTNIFIAFLVLFDKKCRIFVNFWTFFALWLSYLSIFLVGDAFLSYEWDILILETGFLAMFLVPNIQNGSLFTDHISLVSRQLLKWLTFRYTLTNGVLKIIDSDQSSWSAISLQNYYEIQPLPSPFSRMFYDLPVSVHKMMGSYIFIADIILPFLFYFPVRRIRIIAVLCQVPLQLILWITGNHSWLHILLIILLIPMLDDKFLLENLPAWSLKLLGISNINSSEISRVEGQKVHAKSSWLKSICYFIIPIIIVVYSFSTEVLTSGDNQKNLSIYLQRQLFKVNILPIITGFVILLNIFELFCYSLKPTIQKTNSFVRVLKFTLGLIFFALLFSASLYPFSQDLGVKFNNLLLKDYTKYVYDKVENFHIVNSFKAFRVAIKTNKRMELIIEGSYDGRDWLNYEFLYKPLNIKQESTLLLFHQPRLDWQMYVAQLNNINQQPWLINMLGRLFSNSKSVNKLLRHNPFEASPPHYLRIRADHYTYESKNSSNKWRIIEKDSEEYLSPVHRNDTLLRDVLKNAGLQPITKQSQYNVHIWQELPLQSIVLTLFLVSILWNLI